MKKTLSLLCSFFLILSLAFSVFPGDASAKTFPCDQPVGIDTIQKGEPSSWDSLIEARVQSIGLKYKAHARMKSGSLKPKIMSTI